MRGVVISISLLETRYHICHEWVSERATNDILTKAMNLISRSLECDNQGLNYHFWVIVSPNVFRLGTSWCRVLHYVKLFFRVFLSSAKTKHIYSNLKNYVTLLICYRPDKGTIVITIFTLRVGNILGAMVLLSSFYCRSLCILFYKSYEIIK